MTEYGFIYERSPMRRIVTVFITAVIIIITILLFMGSRGYVSKVLTIPWANNTISLLENDVLELNSRGIFYVTFLGDLFFNPLPPEILFYRSLMLGFSPIWVFISATIASIIAHILNYVIGRRCSVFFMTFISKKDVYKIRRSVNRYGSYAVFLFNVTLLPSPLLTFALGITRYNRYRLFTVLFIAGVIKHLGIIGIYLLLS